MSQSNQTKEQKRIKAIIFVIIFSILSLIIVFFAYPKIEQLINKPKLQTNQNGGENKDNKKDKTVYQKKYIKTRFNHEFTTINGKYDVILTANEGSKDDFNRHDGFMIYDKEHNFNLNFDIQESKEGEAIKGDSQIQVKNSSPVIKVEGINNSDLALVVNKNKNIYNLVDLGSGKPLDSNVTVYNSKVTFQNLYGEKWKGRVLKTQMNIRMIDYIDNKELLELVKSIKIIDEIPKRD